MALRLGLRLLKPHSHEIFVALRLCIARFLLSSHGLLQLLFELFYSCLERLTTRLIIILIDHYLGLIHAPLFQFFVSLKQGLHDFLCDEKPFFHLFFA